MTFEELQKIVYDAGIVGAGGAGFPTHRKFSDKVKQIIVNAAECEPLMMVDHHILEHHLQAILMIFISLKRLQTTATIHKANKKFKASHLCGLPFL